MTTPIFDESVPEDVADVRPDPQNTDFASLLSRVYRITESAVTELEVTDDPSRLKSLKNKIDALTRLSKVLPLLQQAEKNAHVRDPDGKDLSDWTTEELRAAVAGRSE